MIGRWLLLPFVILASLVWFVVGLQIGLDHALSDYEPAPAAPTLAVIYVPVAGSSLLIGGAIRHLQDRAISARRAFAGAIVCLTIWAICLIVVLVA